MTARVGCRDLRVTAGGRILLDVPALDVAAGETLAVLGPNGAGKSTLLRALALLLPERTAGMRRLGTVLLDGTPATPAAARAAVAAVLQRPVLQRGTVAENAAAGLRLRGVRRTAARHAAAPWLDALGVAHLAARDARTLSGGEAQRVAIARALAVGPRVLLLDEPFAGLDATTRADLLADLRAVLDGRTTATVLVTHDRHEAAALAGRCALLVGGRLRQVGATAQVLDAPADADCARLLGYTTHLPPALTGSAGVAVARPEQCRVLAAGVDPPPGAVVVAGTVRRLVPLSGAVRVDVTTAAGPLAALVAGDPGVADGAPVRIAVAPGDLRHLAAGGPRPQVRTFGPVPGGAGGVRRRAESRADRGTPGCGRLGR